MLVAGVALAALIAVVPSQDPQTFTWSWSDGSTARQRVFNQVQYPVPSMLPTIVVRADPAEPSHNVRLEYRRTGAWGTESQARTNRRGVARVALNPLCGTEWCSGTYRYRVLVAGKATDLTIRFEPRP